MNAAAPSVPTPAELIPDPAISLTTNELYLTEGDALPNWEDYVASSVGDLTRGGEGCLSVRRLSKYRPLR